MSHEQKELEALKWSEGASPSRGTWHLLPTRLPQRLPRHAGKESRKLFSAFTGVEQLLKTVWRWSTLPAKRSDITSSTWCHFVTSPPLMHPEAIVVISSTARIGDNGKCEPIKAACWRASGLTGSSRLVQEQPIISGIKTNAYSWWETVASLTPTGSKTHGCAVVRVH